MQSKKLLASLAVPPAPVLVPSQRSHTHGVASVTSVVNDKSDNEMNPGTVHRSLYGWGKPQLGNRLMKGLYDQSSPQMLSLTSKRGQ